MPKIEREILVDENIEVVDGNNTQGYIDYPGLATAQVPKTIDISLSPNVLLSSLQVEVTGSHSINMINRRTFGFRSLDNNTVNIWKGPYMPFIRDRTKLDWEIISLAQGIERLGNAAFPILGVDADDPPTGFLTPLPDGGSRIFLTVFRPWSFTPFHTCPTVTQLCQTRLYNEIDWFPYNIRVLITGFVTTDFPQGTGINEEQISCFVKDDNSKALYGQRLSQNEEQSDFIETQRQACRVAESIIRDQNQVIEINFILPFRPAINRGQTIRVQNLAKGIDLHGIVKSYAHTFDTDTATVTTQVTLRTTEYAFRTSLITLTNGFEEIIDLRQTS